MKWEIGSVIEKTPDKHQLYDENLMYLAQLLDLLSLKNDIIYIKFPVNDNFDTIFGNSEKC